MRGGDAIATDFEITAVELANCPHAADDKEDEEEEGEVGEEGIDAEHHKDGGIVAGEVAKVPVYPGLCLSEILWLGDTLEVKKFGEWLEVGEARCDRLRADSCESVGEVEAGGEDVQRDLKTRHRGLYGMCRAKACS